MQNRLPRNKIPLLKKFVQTKPKVKLVRSNGKNRAFIFKFEGKMIYAKETKNNPNEGNTFAIRKRILEHNLKSRDKKIDSSKYKIKLPAIYGQHGNYLLMEFIKTSPKPKKGTPQYQSYLGALDQMINNLNELQEIRQEPLDINHLIYCGVQNKKHVFVLPYDYAI